MFPLIRKQVTWKRCASVLVSLLLVSGLVFSPQATVVNACGVGPGGCSCPGC